VATENLSPRLEYVLNLQSRSSIFFGQRSLETVDQACGLFTSKPHLVCGMISADKPSIPDDSDDGQ
jgi:hypothetical protein